MGISLTAQNVVSALDTAHMAGGASELAVGDRILALDGVDVSNSQAVEKAVRAGPDVEVHTLLVARVVPLRPELTPTLISSRASPMVTPPPEPSPLPGPRPEQVPLRQLTDTSSLDPALSVHAQVIGWL